MNPEEQILQKLRSEDEETRLQVLRELAGGGQTEHYLPLVLEALGDASWRVRKEAVEVFIALPTAGNLAGEIIELLHSEENAGLRNAAVEILVRLGRQAIPLLLEELDCSDHDVRKFVLDILGDIGDDAVLSALVRALDDEDGNVRAAAAENLGKLGSGQAVPALLQAMEHPDLWFRFTILEALGRLGEPVPVEALLQFRDEKLLRKALFDCLGLLGDVDAVSVLVEGLSDEMANVRESAVVALGRIAARFPEPVEKGLVASGAATSGEAVAELLESGDREIRRAAARLLGWIGDGRLAPRILPLFDDEILRESAAHALISLGPAAFRPLMDCWPGADSRTRAYLAYVFGETGCEQAADLLLTAVDSADPELRLVAARALGKIGVIAALPQLIECLGDELEEIRVTAIEALFLLGERHRQAVLEALRPQLEAADPDRRMSVVLVLGRLGGRQVEDCLTFALKDEAAQVRQAAVRALESMAGEGQMPALMLALTDEDAEVRRLAAEALGLIGDPGSLDPLALALEDENIWVRAAAVRALGRISSSRAVQLIERAMDDAVGLVVISALETLNERDAGQAYPLLLRALGHTDEEVVNAALQLLASGGRNDWIRGVREQLLNHPHWEVRTSFARTMAGLEGPDCLAALEERLLIEGEDLVRHQLQELIAALSGQD